MTDPKQQANRVPASTLPKFSPWTQIPSALLVIAAFIVVAEWKPDLVWQALVAVALAGLLLHLHRLESLKVGTSGLEAKMLQSIREADEKIDQLKQLSNQLRDVAKPVIRSGLLQLSWGRLVNGIKLQDQHDLRDRYAQLVEQLGLEDPALNSAFDDFHRLQARDLLGDMIDRSQQIPRFDTAQAEQLRALWDRALHALPKPDEVRQVLGIALDTDPEQKELLQDYEYYLRHHKPRRAEKHW